MYFRKTDVNPSKEELALYSGIIGHVTSSTYYYYWNLFRATGFEREDIVSIANVHLVSYLGLFSIETIPEKYAAFVSLFKFKHKGHNPKASDILDKNKANFTLFLKQRMDDLVRICKQKFKNIKGVLNESYVMYYGPKVPPENLQDLVEHHEKFGFKKLSPTLFRAIRKQMKGDFQDVFQLNDNWYVRVLIEQKFLTYQDLTGSPMDTHSNVHCKDPESIFSELQCEDQFLSNKEMFKNYSDRKKKEVLTTFIVNNKGNQYYQEEIVLAHKLLKSLGG